MIPGDAEIHEPLMSAAFELARRGIGRVAPNPPVGAILINDELQVAEGWHAQYGGPHAEAACLAAARSAGIETRGSTMIVTLEPCGHEGKTPPCSQAIIDAGVGRVIYSHPDPHPVTRGRGLQQLEAAGVEVIGGVLEAEGARLLAPYLCHTQRGRPLVTAKWAMTLDGRIASATGDSKWITSEETRRWTRERRGHHGAILVGIGTVEADDPQLTSRTEGMKDPLRVVIDPGARISADRQLLHDGGAVLLVVQEGKSVPDFLPEKVEVIEVPAHRKSGSASQIDIDDLLRKLGDRGIQSLLVEGGAVTIGHFFDAGKVDRCEVLIAPKVIGGAKAPGPVAGRGLEMMTLAIEALDPRWTDLGPDRLLEASLSLAGRGRYNR